MNKKLVCFALEHLHRDPEFLHQETRTSVQKVFGDRATVDILIEIIYNPKIENITQYMKSAADERKMRLDRERDLTLRILELEAMLRNEESKFNMLELDYEYLAGGVNRKPSARNCDYKSQHSSETKEVAKERVVRVWSHGARSVKK